MRTNFFCSGTLGVVVSGVFVIVSPYLHQGVLLCYWLPSTLMSVMQTLSLRVPAFGVARSIRVNKIFL